MPLHSLIPLACVNDPQDLHSRLLKTTVHASSSTWTTGISAGKHRFKKAAEKDWLVVTNRVSLLPQSHTNICKTWEECWESSFFLEGGKEREALLNSEKLWLVAECSINENRFGTFWNAVKMLIRLRAPVVTGDLSMGWSGFLYLWTCLWYNYDYECININNEEWFYLLYFCGCNVVLLKRKKERNA